MNLRPNAAFVKQRPWLWLVMVVIVFGGVGWRWWSVGRPWPGTNTVLTNVPANTVVTNGRLAHHPQPVCPAGYILVPGSVLYHTSDFCVMKYEAKCAAMADPAVGIQPPASSACFGRSGSNPEGVYNNSRPACACNIANGKRVVSTAAGFPITFIPGENTSGDNAKSYCQSIGAHLITNPEWMTIARDVEQVPANWCDRNGASCGWPPGTTGKILANGHNDDHNETTASGDGNGALVAGADNQPCFGTTTDGSNICGGKSSQKRTLTLNNDQVIWDLAGNVWEWVDTTTARKDEPKSATHGVLDLGWTRSDFAPGSLPSVLTDNGQGPTLGYDAFRPSNPTWNATNGVGRIYHYSSANDASVTQYDFLRGGNWRHYDDDGAFTIHLSPPITKAGIDDVGFRCVTAVQ